MSDEIVENLKKPSAWLRVLFMAGFAVALYVVGVVLLVLMLAQIVFSLVTGSDNINLRRLGSSLSEYIAQILAFLTYNSEEKPFPFAQFPLSDHGQADLWDDIAPEADSAAKSSAAAAASTAKPETPATPAATSAEPVVDEPVTTASKAAAGKKPAAKKRAPKPATVKDDTAIKTTAPRSRSAASKTSAPKASTSKPAAPKTASNTSTKSAVKKSTSKGAGTNSKAVGTKSND